MHAGLTDSQRELRDSVRAVLAAHCPTSVVRESYDDPDRWRDLWKIVVELGWTELAERDPSAGSGAVELALVLEECGRAAVPSPVLSSVGLAAGASSAVRAEVAAGAVATLACARVGARGLVPSVRFEGGRLIGQAGAVPDAPRAELLVVLARSTDGYVSAVVRTSALTVRPGESLDPGRPLADVDFDAEPESVAATSLSEALAAPLCAAAAELVGVASRLLELAVDHAKTRVQFGQPIGAFQGVKHMIADTYVALERARSLTYLAAMHLDAAGPPESRWRAAALAKAAASEAALTASRTCVQVHGAIAQTWEHDAHLFVRRAWQSAASMGASGELYREVAATCI